MKKIKRRVTGLLIIALLVISIGGVASADSQDPACDCDVYTQDFILPLIVARDS